MIINKSAADRGSADSYYRREQQPHKVTNNEKVLLQENTPEWDEYIEAYEANELAGNWKDWG